MTITIDNIQSRPANKIQIGLRANSLNYKGR